jgi:dihydroneopterin aldolase / 2-amino-4-hydroxy-6-hydroxymethyldihydropteridine diphosphokinase
VAEAAPARPKDDGAPVPGDEGASPAAARGYPAKADRIQLRRLRLLGAHGALPGEQLQRQPFEVDLDIYGDLSRAGHSDALADTVDYGALCEAARAVVEGPHVALLERLAERLAEEVFRVGGPVVLGVEVSVRKLRPPVPFDLGSAGARIYRSAPGLRGPGGQMVTAFVALGSNMGDRWAYLRQGVAALPDVVAISNVYETVPVGGPGGQGPYLNMAAMLRTRLAPASLLGAARRAEEAADRDRTVRWGPRTLDVDILLYGDASISTPELEVPHPRMWERGFVLLPLAELAPELVAGRLRPGMTDGARLVGPLEGANGPGASSAGGGSS